MRTSVKRTTGIYISLELLQRIEKIAKERDWSLNKTICRLLEYALAQKNPPPYFREIVLGGDDEKI